MHVAIAGTILLFTLVLVSCRAGVLGAGTTDRHQLISQVLLLMVGMSFFSALIVLLNGNVLVGISGGLVVGLLWDLHEAPNPLLKRIERRKNKLLECPCIEKWKNKLLEFARKLEKWAQWKGPGPRDDAPPL